MNEEEVSFFFVERAGSAGSRGYLGLVLVQRRDEVMGGSSSRHVAAAEEEFSKIVDSVGGIKTPSYSP